MSSWFEVDREGLRKLLADKPKSFILFELLQNAWDERTSEVSVTLEPVRGRAAVKLSVEDDSPEGFSTLAHAYTMFAESKKKTNPEQRGRFNIGEKMVLALAGEARIISTTGTIIFTATGRQKSRGRRERGTLFEATIPMTRAEAAELERAARRVIPPAGVRTTFNGELIKERSLLHSFSAVLPTVIAGPDGVLKRTARKTTVSVYEPLAGEEAAGWIFELGIPVVETGDRYTVSIGQKVPLTLDRDNLPASYLRTLRTLLFNEMCQRVEPEEATAPWVREALSDQRCSDEAVRRAISLRFGARAVIADPSDEEATKRAVSEGYTVVSGGALNKDEWRNIKRSGALLPAGKVTPSPKPFSPDGRPLKMLALSEYTDGMSRVVEYAKLIGEALLGGTISVEIANDSQWPFGAAYGSRRLILNAGRLGKEWFEQGASVDVNDLLIHEYGHEYSPDHLSKEYHDALSKLGAMLTALALARPVLFLRYRVDDAESQAATERA